jgi:prepilin-type N-terminal cleavage/methylation domain-containing protein
MLKRLRNRQRGFTLIELLIVVAIIGIIAAILIPNLIDALQKAKQKRTMADMRNTGTAWMSWLTDALGGAAAGQANTWAFTPLTTFSYADLTQTLRPTTTFFYMQEVPQKDGWKHEFVYWFSGDPAAARVMAIQSYGRDTTGAATYTTGPFIPTDYDQDIVWSDGYFVRWPGGQDTGGGS